MSDNISIDDFNREWTFFMRKIEGDYYMYNEREREYFENRFECGSFSCPGCNDWLDADCSNRNFYNWNSFRNCSVSQQQFFHIPLSYVLKVKSAFKPDLIEELGEGDFAKVFKAKFHGKHVAMKYIPLDKVKEDYQYRTKSYGFHEYYNQEKVCSSATGVVSIVANPKVAKSWPLKVNGQQFAGKKVGHYRYNPCNW